MTTPTTAEVEAMLAARLAAEPNARARLLAQPHATIAELTGVQIPAHIAVTVHEVSPLDLHLRVPAELSLDELDAAVGGFGGQWKAEVAEWQ